MSAPAAGRRRGGGRRVSVGGVTLEVADGATCRPLRGAGAGGVEVSGPGWEVAAMPAPAGAGVARLLAAVESLSGRGAGGPGWGQALGGELGGMAVVVAECAMGGGRRGVVQVVEGPRGPVALSGRMAPDPSGAPALAVRALLSSVLPAAGAPGGGARGVVG